MSLESSVGLWDAISFWFITIGIITTFVVGIAAIRFRYWNGLPVAQQEAQQRKDKEDAEAALASLNLKIADANAREKQAELELAKLKEPRSLTTDQSAKIADAIKPFAETKFSVAVFIRS
jgi:uncharacterized protein YlxW (UPF0749 family)